VTGPRARGASAGAVARSALIVLSSLCACAGQSARVDAPKSAALCHIDASAGADKPPRERTYPAQYWFVLLLQGYRSAGDFARPARDCRGLPVELEVDGCGVDPEPVRTPTGTLTPHDLVIANLGDAQRLVWVITDRLSNGEAEGPVALAEILQGGIEVRAMGLLRAYPERVSLRLEHLGTGTVLVAEGERCGDPKRSETCERGLRIVPRVGDRFVPKPVMSESGACLERAVIEVRGAGSAPGKGRVRYAAESVVTFGPEGATIREQLALSNGSSEGASSRDSFVRRVQADRQLRLRAGTLVSTAPSLLARWRGEAGGDFR
jgi:hypothetical protein